MRGPQKLRLPYKRKMGRPLKPFSADEDRYDVAFLEMLKLTRIGGKRPSTKRAAKLAALLADFDFDTTFQYRLAPPREWVTRRRSPLKASLADGYVDWFFCHKSKKAGVNHAFEAKIKRLELKHREWTQRNAPEEMWIGYMAMAWAAATFPYGFRDRGLDPQEFCIVAASKVQELHFALVYLLPLLWEQELLPNRAYLAAA